MVLLTLIAGVALFAPWLTHLDPFALTGGPLAPPSAQHLMGTDALGRDVFSGLAWGARTSLFVAISVSTLTMLCGLAVGVMSGYAGGWVDDLLTGVTALLQVIPRFFLVIVAVALAGPGLDRLIITLGLTSWPVLARVVRNDIVALQQMDFVIAAQASGASRARVIWRSLLPHVMPSATVVIGLLLGQILLLEASLGFLGLGDPGTMSWGLIAARAHEFTRVAWWLPLFPGLAICLTVVGINLLVDAYASSRRHC